MLKNTFTKNSPNTLKYRCYKKFHEDKFLTDIKESIIDNGNYSNLENNFKTVVEKHAPLKVKQIRGNSKPHVDRNLRKEIMIRSQLRNKANKTGKTSDFLKYKKQRNKITKINNKKKKEFLKLNKPKGTKCKDFWSYCRPYFSNKNFKSTESIIPRSFKYCI